MATGDVNINLPNLSTLALYAPSNKTVIDLLRWGPGLTMILFGLNQIVNPTAWTRFIPARISQTLSSWGISNEMVMMVHAAINILLGFLLISGIKSSTIAWITLFWWLSIIPFAFMVDWTIGVRDTAITLSIMALIGLLSTGGTKVKV